MANLVNLNVDTLFEQHSVAEIDIIQKKVQAVVEEKREELRTMVGERYRDLLKAADTIVTMQESSTNLTNQIIAIEANCRKLNEQQLIGFKIDIDNIEILKHRRANKQLHNYFSIMVQIKLLTSLPELIWSEIDREHFCTATELFIFSRHISTGLQLDAQNPIMQNLPVAKKQWEILKPFHTTIKHCVLNVLQREGLGEDTTVDCLMSLLLLEKGNINEVLKSFLQLRSAAFLNCLSEDGLDGAHNRRVKERILASLKVLNGTIELMQRCFIENTLLSKRIAEYTRSDALPTISLMDSNDAQYVHMLPEIISNFRPKLETQQLNHTQMCSSLENWVQNVKVLGSDQLKQLFDLVSVMSILQEIKTEANNHKKSLDLPTIIEKFKISQSLDFYELKYVPLINHRVQDIIAYNLQQISLKTFESIEKILQKIESQDEENIWLENAADLPLSLEEALSEDCKVKKLLMKTKGYTADIIELCTEFDKGLARILTEMNVIMEEETIRLEDKITLMEFLKDTTHMEITKFLQKLKSIELQDENRLSILYIIRICVGLVELCPHLKMCFCQRSSWRQGIQTDPSNSLESFTNVCELIADETFNFWLRIIDGVLTEYNFQKFMPSKLDYDTILEDFPNWESITIEQKDEQENVMTTTFRVPCQPCISLQQYLSTLITVLNANVPQTLPSKVLRTFIHKLLEQLLSYYYKLVNIEQESSSLPSSSTIISQPSTNQNVALQLYFDLKCLQNIFHVTREDRLLIDKFTGLQQTLRERIDPFDFELFVEPITMNVKRAAFRFNNQLGVITPLMPMTSTTPNATVAITQEKDPNVLSLSSCGSTSLWFPSLPIVSQSVNAMLASSSSTSSSTLSTSFKEEKKNATSEAEKTTPLRKSNTSSSSRTKNETKSKSGAASFFGAMSQEWFR